MAASQDHKAILGLRGARAKIVLLVACLFFLAGIALATGYISTKGANDCSQSLSTVEARIYAFFGGRISTKEPILFENTIHYADRVHILNCSTGEWTETEARNDDVIARARDKGYQDCTKDNDTPERRFYGWYFEGKVAWEEVVLFGKEVYTLDCYTGTVAKQMIMDTGQCGGAFILGLVLFVVGMYYRQLVTYHLSDGTQVTARRYEISKHGRYYRVRGMDINEDHITRITYS